MIHDYIRKVHYHETDKMGVTHHANYIKWMEEARVDFLNQIGYGYARLERDGITRPSSGSTASINIRPRLTTRSAFILKWKNFAVCGLSLAIR